MSNEISGFGDYAEISMQSNVDAASAMGVHGWYHAVCKDANGNVKWEESFPNAVVAVGKQLLLDTLLRGSSYSVVGPYLGLTSGTTTPAYSDTMASHAGWTEYVNYTVSASAVRGTAVFAASSSNTTASPNNVTTSSATAITYTVTGAGGTIGGCFLVTGTGAVNTQSSTAGTLYSAGAFTAAKTVTAGDTVQVTYSTTATG